MKKFKSKNKSKSNKQTKSIFFYSYKLNKDKFNIIKNYAQTILDTKNHLSMYVKNNLLIDLFNNKYTSIDFINLTKNLNIYKIGSSFYQQVQKEVYTKYMTQLSTIEYKAKYLKNTELSTTVQYLVKVYKGNIVNIINYLSKSNKQHHKTILNIINKYDIRLWNLVSQIQSKLLKKFKLITFKTLYFNGINQLTVNKLHNFIEFTNNIKLTNTVINLNIPKMKDIIVIPTLFNKKYHKNLNYKQSFSGLTNSKQTQTSYQCTIVNNRIRITITRDEDKHIFNNEIDNFIGIDVNTRDNLFSLSDNNIIKYDKWIIDKFKRLQYHLTKKQRNKENEKVKTYSKSTIKMINKMNRQSKYYNDLKSKELVDYCLQNNYNHIIMEDLNIQNSKGYYNYKDNINYNDISKVLHLNNYKNTIKRIANKYNITVSFTNPEYTSQTCSKCGYIHKKNREQETFSCLKCNHTLNADYNAAINIKQRVSNAYLKDALHNTEIDTCKHYLPKKYISKNTYINLYKDLYSA